MKNLDNSKVKYSTYINSNIANAIRDFAHDKKVSAGYVIESAIKKCMPESYINNSK